VSGLAAAEASGRAFRMIWPRTRACGAAFGELLVNDWPVLDVDKLDPAWKADWLENRSVRKRPNPISDPRPDLAFGTSWWLLPLDDPARAAERARCTELLAKLEPVQPIRERIAEFRTRHFRSTMIGVHLRRGDFFRARPDSAGNTPAALVAIDRFLAEAPDAGIFLCTDDAGPDHEGRHAPREGVRELLRTRYGERVVPSAARSLDRRTVEGIQDALLDFLLLRSTQIVIGTAASSFSSLAVFGRSVPHALVAGGTPEYRRQVRRARLTGVYWIVIAAARLLYGERVTFAMARQRLTGLKVRWKARVRDALRRR
jgi:hypothetical protein